MKALSLSKSTPRNNQGNRLWARLIASTTSEPSRVSISNGRHSVQPVATSTIVRVWMNEPATDVPPWATMSTSQKPGGGLFQSLNVRIGTSRRIAEIESGTTPPAAARRDLHIDEQAIDGSGADGQNTITVRLAKLQSAMLLEGRQQDRDHHL